MGGEAHLEEGDEGRILVNGGWQNDYPAIEIYDVAGDDGFAVSSDLGFRSWSAGRRTCSTSPTST